MHECSCSQSSSDRQMGQSFVDSVQERNEPWRIVSIDDCQDNLYLIEVLLEGYGNYQVSSFSNPYTALEAIKQTPPSLLLLDLMMPEMTGSELLQKLRHDDRLPRFPVIIVTAKNIEDVDPESLSQANDFIKKPYEIDNLLAKVNLHIAQPTDEAI